MGFAVAARRRGLSILYLGANVPVASWVRTSEASAAGRGDRSGRDADAPRRPTWSCPAGVDHRPAVFVGGRAAARVAAATGAVALPDQMEAAVEVVRRLVRPTDQRDGS